MSKVFTRVYSDEAIPNAQPHILIHANKLKCIRVRIASEGRITKVAVVQQSGTPVDLKVELLASKIPYPGDTEQTIPYTPADDVQLYRIMPQQSGTAGVMEFIHDSTGYPYINFDGTSTDNQPYLYLVIIPTGAASDTTWDAAITAERDVG